MTKDTIILKYGEMVLKGRNKPFFESKLIQNIKESLLKIGNFDIIKSRSLIYIKSINERELTEAFVKLKKVFGISVLVFCYSCPKEMLKICEFSTKVAELCFKNENIKTFKINTTREDKKFEFSSMEVSKIIGTKILEYFKERVAVDVKNPDLTIYIELRDKCYIYTSKEIGARGMPRGTAGSGLLLLSGGIDSPVAGFKMAKRGLRLEAIHFHSYPYTTTKSKEKVIDITEKISQYCGSLTLHMVSFTEIQSLIIENLDRAYLTILMRIYMLEVAEKLAHIKNLNILITGESLGQVASQTQEALSITDKATNMLIARPLLGYDKEEIVQIARKINTYELSILPYEDCCTIFVPKNPVTKPKESTVDQLKSSLEKKVDIESMIANTIKNREVIEFSEA